MEAVRRRGGRCWLLFCTDTVAHVHGCMLSHLRHKIDSISCLTRVLGGLEGAMHCPNSALNVGMRGMCVGHGSGTASPPPIGRSLPDLDPRLREMIQTQEFFQDLESWEPILDQMPLRASEIFRFQGAKSPNP